MIFEESTSVQKKSRLNDVGIACSRLAKPPKIADASITTGTEMIIWGGVCEPGDHFFNTGGRYNPDTDTWTAISTTNAPTARVCPAVWTGIEMIVWGGDAFPIFYNTGGRYNPSTDSWTATSTTNAPSARSAMIVWAGLDSGFNHPNTGGRYCAAGPSPTPRPTPTPRARPTPAPRPR